jgi:glutamyl-tRNA synthetase
MSNVRTRMAPSPTGYFHVGSARTALFNYIYAKKTSGKFILRIEDTDIKRNNPEFEKDILEQMIWLGLNPDETYKQSDLLKSHEDALKNLLGNDRAFISKETSKENKNEEVEVIRLRNKGENVKFNDLIRGEISFDTTELGDFVIARNINEPLYHLAVVVDDNEMNISHIIRGEDHISNTARQILIGRALEYDEPQYAHLPLILAPDKSKLSKRKHSFAVVKQLRKDGFEAEAIVNFLTLLGWSPKGDREVLSLKSVISEFELSNVHKSGAVFDIEKLKWLNREYLLKMDDSKFSDIALEKMRESSIVGYDDKVAVKLVPILRERINYWGEIRDLKNNGNFDYYFTCPKIDAKKLPWRETSKDVLNNHLRSVVKILSEANELSFENAESVKNLIWNYANDHGRGEVLWPIRYALSGQEKSPDPFTLISILGKKESISRIENAIL